MRTPLKMPDEPQPRKITRADLVMTDGFGLEVDRRMKTVFERLKRHKKKAGDPKAEFPMLQRRCGKQAAGIVVGSTSESERCRLSLRNYEMGRGNDDEHLKRRSGVMWRPPTLPALKRSNCFEN